MKLKVFFVIPNVGRVVSLDIKELNFCVDLK
jgi:hypothetical protein